MSQKQIRYINTQSGRSMVEMLGTLAIMGVLTIGGVAGYRYAINKSNANTILGAVSQMAVTASTELTTQGSLTLPEWKDANGNLSISGAFGVETARYDDGAFGIIVSNMNDEVCERIKGMDWKVPEDIAINGETGVCDQGEANKIAFVFSNTLTKKSAPGNTGGESGEDTPDEPETPNNPCASFQETDCILTCNNNNGTAEYTYAAYPTTCNTPSNNTGTCDGKGNCLYGQCPAMQMTVDGNTYNLPESGAGMFDRCYSMSRGFHCTMSGQWITQMMPCLEIEIGPCSGFSPTTCTTNCTNTNGTAKYTYASNTTSCQINGKTGTCNGSGTCVEPACSGFLDANGNCCIYSGQSEACCMAAKANEGASSSRTWHCGTCTLSWDEPTDCGLCSKKFGNTIGNETCTNNRKYRCVENQGWVDIGECSQPACEKGPYRNTSGFGPATAVLPDGEEMQDECINGVGWHCPLGGGEWEAIGPC